MPKTAEHHPRVAVIMGSQSDWACLRETCELLEKLQIAFRAKLVSAHRTPERLYSFAKNAQANGFRVIIAGAGGAAHLPGMVASLSALPVIGVPVAGKFLQGLDSLLSIVQMPAGVPVCCMATGNAGARNAALAAAAILALADTQLAARLQAYRAAQSASVADQPTDKT